MTEKKYQVFISSTYSDLIEERKKTPNTAIHIPVSCFAGVESYRFNIKFDLKI